jgi:hypothetical protein
MVSKSFDQTASDLTIFPNMKECQAELNRWGAVNQVSFDLGKESPHILDGRRPYGDYCRFMGVIFDSQLTMRAGIRDIAAQGHGRVQMVKRSCGHPRVPGKTG